MWTSKKCAEKCDARAELLFLLYKNHYFSCRHEKLLPSSMTRRGTELKKVAHTEVVDREYCLSGSQSSLLLVHSRYGSNTCSHAQKPTETYRAFSLTWPASMQIYWNKINRWHKKRVQLPKDWFGTPTWPPFHCFGTPIWPP